ncbi:MAG: hypothetical protein AAGK21_17900, partial [Bacteroidota bacterium]
MSTFPLSLFDAASDAESARYRVLAGLAGARTAFQTLQVEPHYGDLVATHRALQALVAGADAVEASQPIVGVDWAEGRVVRRDGGAPLAVGLARWALPLVEGAIAEGRLLYEFASDHAELRAVGLVPAYRDEGVLIVLGDSGLRVLHYRISPLSGPGGRYRALRTMSLDVPLDPLATPQSWKQALAEALPALPTPAAFQLSADVDLPVDPTLVPVAKRKLLGAVG